MVAKVLTFEINGEAFGLPPPSVPAEAGFPTVFAPHLAIALAAHRRLDQGQQFGKIVLVRLRSRVRVPG